MNPWSIVGSFVADLIQQKKLEKWYKLIFVMSFSGLVTFLSTTGSALIAHQSIPVSIGTGFLASAGTLVFLYARSPLTKAMMIAVPKDVIVKGEAEGLATITPK